MLARMLTVLAVAWPLGCGGQTFDGPLTYVRGGGETGQARTLIVRPDGTGSVQLEHGIDAPERVTLRLTVQERDRLARLVGEVDLGAVAEDEREPIPDAYGYSVRLGDDEASWQSEGLPPELQALWRELEALAEKYGPQPA
jgi:hypothetical protein